MKHRFDIKIEEIQKYGKSFNWKRPQCNCGSKVHGHGFVARYFNRYNEHIFIKRWRCPNCKIVITARPLTYWSRFQTSIDDIFDTLKYRIKYLKWPPWTTRQRAGHWLNKLLVNAKLYNLMKDDVYETIIFHQDKKISIN